MQSGYNLDVYIGSASIDMYVKCGVLEMVLLVFFKLQGKNLFCWYSVIDGLAVHGHAVKALLVMFSRMENIKPNDVTFVGILGASTRAGLVEKGRRIFFNMTTKIKHYGCMIDYTKLPL